MRRSRGGGVPRGHPPAGARFGAPRPFTCNPRLAPPRPFSDTGFSLLSNPCAGGASREPADPMFRFLQPSSGWSSLAPIACAVHCAAAPFLVALSPALAESTQLEWGFLGATLLFGLVGLPERTHALRDPRP